MDYGLYLHTPFCATKCPYCDFYSGVFAESRVRGFVDAVLAEAGALAGGEPASAALVASGPAASCFVGGGTPTHLAPAAIARLLGGLAARLPLAPGAEFTVEANPESLTPETADLLAELGVNRLSIGVQSLDDAVLERLGRPHDAARALAAVEIARPRFPQLNVDLIAGAPGLTRTALGAALDRLLDLGPDHLSAYGLTIEPGTAYAELAARGRLKAVSDREMLAQDALIESRCAAAGLSRYEISNYARPGAECRHNLAVWRGGFYLGLGPSAHSHLPGGRAGVRRANVRDLGAYVACVARGASPVAMTEALGTGEAMAEVLLLGLRLAAGVDLEAFARRFGVGLDRAVGDELERQIEAGLLRRDGGRLATTARGRAVLDSIVARLAGPLLAAA